MRASGGWRRLPSAAPPTVVGDGSGLPVDSNETDGEVISVMVRLVADGRNSRHRAADGDVVADRGGRRRGALVKTRMPSDVATFGIDFRVRLLQVEAVGAHGRSRCR